MLNVFRALAASALLAVSAPTSVANTLTDTLPPDPIRLDTLHVQVGSRASSSMSDVVRGVQVIGAAELRKRPARSLADLLAHSIGVDVLERSPAQTDLALRGGSFEQVLILVDGVRASSRQTGHLDLDHAVPLAEIEQIEILRGPATALYGSDAIGGVINIVTRRTETGRENEGTAPAGLELGPSDARLAAGSFDAYDAALTTSARLGSTTLRIGVEGSQADGHRPGTDHRMLLTRLAVDAPLAGRTLRVDLAAGRRDFGARGFYAPPSAPYDEFEATRNVSGSLAWLVTDQRDADATRRIVLEPRVSVRRHQDTFLLQRDDPSFYRNRHVTWQLGGELLARTEFSDGTRLVIGAEAYQDRLESNGLGEREETQSAVFAEAILGGASRLVLQPGLRLDHHSGPGAFFAPSLAAAVHATDHIRLRASAGRAFRAPSWTERYYEDPSNIADPELGPERAWEAETGVEIDVGHARIGVAGFLRHAHGLIDWARPADASDDEPWRTHNVEDATFRGLELEAMAPDILATRWELALTLLSAKSESARGYASKYALRPLTRTASLTAERALHPNVLASARLYHARRADAAPDSITDGAADPDTGCTAGAAETHTRGDARLSVLLRQFRLYIDGFNLTGARYCDVNAFEAPGRSMKIGVSWGR